MFITINLTAGQRVEFREVYDFVRIMESTAAVNLEFFRKEREVDEAVGVVSGFSETFEAPCDRLVIVNGATAQAVTFATRQGSRVEYERPPTGNVAITNMGGQFVANLKAVASVVGGNSEIISTGQVFVNNRRFLAIQNKSSGSIWIGFTTWGRTPDNAPITADNGLEIEAGQTFQCDGFAPTGFIICVAQVAGAKVLVVEG